MLAESAQAARVAAPTAGFAVELVPPEARVVGPAVAVAHSAAVVVRSAAGTLQTSRD